MAGVCLLLSSMAFTGDSPPFFYLSVRLPGSLRVLTFPFFAYPVRLFGHFPRWLFLTPFPPLFASAGALLPDLSLPLPFPFARMLLSRSLLGASSLVLFLLLSIRRVESPLPPRCPLPLMQFSASRAGTSFLRPSFYSSLATDLHDPFTSALFLHLTRQVLLRGRRISSMQLSIDSNRSRN